MAYYLSKFLPRLPEETKSAEELLVNLIAVKFAVERANRLILFYWESNCMNLTGQTVMWSDMILLQSCYNPGKIIYSSGKL